MLEPTGEWFFLLPRSIPCFALTAASRDTANLYTVSQTVLKVQLNCSHPRDQHCFWPQDIKYSKLRPAGTTECNIALGLLPRVWRGMGTDEQDSARCMGLESVLGRLPSWGRWKRTGSAAGSWAAFTLPFPCDVFFSVPLLCWKNGANNWTRHCLQQLWTVVLLQGGWRPAHPNSWWTLFTVLE